jgi:hypothetical protein
MSTDEEPERKQSNSISESAAVPESTYYSDMGLLLSKQSGGHPKGEVQQRTPTSQEKNDN